MRVKTIEGIEKIVMVISAMHERWGVNVFYCSKEELLEEINKPHPDIIKKFKSTSIVPVSLNISKKNYSLVIKLIKKYLKQVPHFQVYPGYLNAHGHRDEVIDCVLQGFGNPSRGFFPVKEVFIGTIPESPRDFLLNSINKYPQGIPQIEISEENFLSQIPNGKRVIIIPESEFYSNQGKHPLEIILQKSGISYGFQYGMPEFTRSDYLVDLSKIKFKSYIPRLKS